jgi:hypothetical protein
MVGRCEVDIENIDFAKLRAVQDSFSRLLLNSVCARAVSRYKEF